jgi:hypothetical protein
MDGKASCAKSLLSIINRPYRDEFGPPEKIAKPTTLAEVLEDAKFKGKAIEYV